MQKAVLKVYVEGKKFPLFSCKILNDVESTIESLEKQITDKSLEVVKFGQICFKRSLFHHYEIEYK